MSHVRKITNRPRQAGGPVTTSWQARWKGADGKIHAKNFPRKGDADAHLKTVSLGGGSPTMSVKDLAAAHYAYFATLVDLGTREQATLDGYGTAMDVHLVEDPKFGALRLCDLTTPVAQGYLDDMLTRTGSLDLVSRHRTTLVTWCKFGQRKGWLVGNPAEPCKVEETERPEEGEDAVIIPPKAQLAAVLRAAETGPHAARDTAIVRLFMFAGLRSSELLGLADTAAKLTKAGGDIQVRERLERRYCTLGKVKSKAGRRDVPIGPQAALAVRAWRLQRGPVHAFAIQGGKGQRAEVPGRLFPAPDGSPLWSYQALIRDMWRPLMDRAGLLEKRPDKNGTKRPVAVFSPHALRHAFASINIENGVRPKRLQDLMGHSTLTLTMDTYGHLWRDADEDDAIVNAAEALITKNTG